MGSAKRLTTDEREIIRALYPSYSLSDIARKLNRSRTTVAKAVAEEGLRERAAKPDAPEPVSEASGDAALPRMRELRDRLRRAMFEAPPSAMAALAREYRATIETIERMEGGDGDAAAAALDALAGSIASKLSS